MVLLSFINLILVLNFSFPDTVYTIPDYLYMLFCDDLSISYVHFFIFRSLLSFCIASSSVVSFLPHWNYFQWYFWCFQTLLPIMNLFFHLHLLISELIDHYSEFIKIYLLKSKIHVCLHLSLVSLNVQNSSYVPIIFNSSTKSFLFGRIKSRIADPIIPFFTF